MKYLQGYRMLTTFLYRLICNIIIPIIITVAGLICYNYFGIITFYVILGTMMLLEIVEDYWGFCGIFRKGTNKLDYIKSAFHGDLFLKNAILADLIIRPLRIFLVIFISSFIYLKQIESLRLIILGGIVTTLISISMVNAVRYIEMFQVIIISGNLATMIGMSIFVLIMLSNNYMTILMLILAVLAVIIGVLTYKHMEKRIIDSYYDC